MKQLREKLSEKKLDYLLLNSEHNRLYLTGFSGSAGWVLVGLENAYLFVDSRYTELAAKQSADLSVIQIDKGFGTFWKEFSASLEGRVGFESHKIDHQTLLLLRRNSPNITLIPTTNIVEQLRAVKDDSEIALIRASVDVADRAFGRLLTLVKPGLTELQVAWELEKLMREEGAEKIAWHPLIVASGVNSSMPHYQPGQHKLKNKDMVMLDFGAVVGGYHSDITRMIFLGAPSAEQIKVYNTVHDSQERAKEKIEHDAKSFEIDSHARDVIEKQSYESYGHGLSHGIGLEVHELPRVSRFSKDILKEGNVISVEPGIYIPGWGGVRIEDLVVVTKSGAETLTKSPKDIKDLTI